MMASDNHTSDAIAGDVLTAARFRRNDVEILPGSNKGIEYRAKVQVPIDYYRRRGNITEEQFRAANRLYRDFFLSGQIMPLTVNLDSVGSDCQRAFLPLGEIQRNALDSWRSAITAVDGKIAQLLLLNVCCYGYWLKEVRHIRFKKRYLMARFKKALDDLIDHYEKT